MRSWPCITRVFAKSEVAAYDLCAATVLFLTPFFELGMAATIGRFFHHYDDESDRSRVFSAAVVFVSVCATLGAIVVAFFSPMLSMLVFQDERHASLIVLSRRCRP